MTIQELAIKLKDMYDNAKTNEKVTMIHLFGITYGEIIRDNDFSIKDIVTQAQLNDSYTSEITKGINLAKYVNVK
jgi:5-methylcytosine-specific restriction protein B